MDSLTSTSVIEMQGLLPKDSRCHKEKDVPWHTQNIEHFRQTLKKQDMEMIYQQYGKMRLIDLMCIKIGCSEYLEAIIAAGGDINLRNPTTNKYPIHYASEVGNIDALRILLASGVDVNVQNEDAETSLHYIVKFWESENDDFRNCLRLLLDCPTIDVNVPNERGFTPIHLAGILGKKSIIDELLLGKHCFSIDIFRSCDERTAMDDLFSTFPDIRESFENRSAETIQDASLLRNILFNLIITKQESMFCSKFKDGGIKELVSPDSHNGRFTYLQYACYNGQIKAAKTLIGLGANVNYAPVKPEKPITLACIKGHHELLPIICSQRDFEFGSDENGETPFHTVLKSPDTSIRHRHCIKRLLQYFSDRVNCQDGDGRTPLHYAVKYDNEPGVFELLNHGAKMNISDNFGEMPVSKMSFSTLKKFFDSKIDKNDKRVKDMEYAVKLDFSFLALKKNSVKNDNLITNFDTDLLRYLSDSDNKKILTHPILSTIISFKWQRIKEVFYINLVFYSVFYLTLNVCIIIYPHAGINNVTLLGGANVTDVHVATAFTTADVDLKFRKVFNIILWLLVIVVVLIEIFRIYKRKSSYIKNWENLLTWAVILSSVTISVHNVQHYLEESYPSVASFVILFCWFEFFFTVGRHPRFTLYTHMFRTASGFVFKFMALHTFLLVGFAFSFHILFRNCDSCTGNDFSNLGGALFQTMIMVTGEFDLSAFSQNPYLITCRIIIIAFIIFIAVILFNLLVGLAVSAAKPIKYDSFLYACRARVKIISDFEEIILSDNCDSLRKYLVSLFCNYCRKSEKDFKEQDISNKKTLTLLIYPNEKNRMEMHSGDENVILSLKKLNYKLDQKILEDSQHIIASEQDAKQKKWDKVDDLRIQMESLKNAFEEEIRVCKMALLEIIEKLDNRLGLETGAGVRVLSNASQHLKKKKKSDAFLRKINSKKSDVGLY